MSFDITLSGINAINSQLDTISNNIANSSTYGFKSSRANFASMYAGSQATGTEVTSLTQTLDVGGSTLTTGRDMDASISGNGFFVVRDANSAQEYYTRVGIFSTDKSGFVVDSTGRRVQGYAAVKGSSALGALGDITVPTGQIPAQATSTLAYVANLSADWSTPKVATFDKTDPQSFNSSMVTVVYDSLGVQHSMTQYFVKTGDDKLTAHYTFDGADLAATTAFEFNTNGQLISPSSSVALTLGTPAGAAALTVNVDYTGTTQFAGEATNTKNSPDGNASGTLTGVQITKDGSVVAQYSNGQKQSVGTIALATFPDESGLSAVSDTSWTATSASGSALYFAPGTGMAGSLAAGSLEQSNVNITEELVNLMSAQRNYQANTKAISAQNEVLQSLMQAI
jgi:flagellar hook protein FlgE